MSNTCSRSKKTRRAKGLIPMPGWRECMKFVGGVHLKRLEEWWRETDVLLNDLVMALYVIVQ